MKTFTKVGIGQDSHRFLAEKGDKKCIIGGVIFEDEPGWDADSDGDMVYHAICNAITSITHVPILGKIAMDMCRKEKITDSKCYLIRAKETLGDHTIVHVALTIEAKHPKMQPFIDQMRANIARLLDLTVDQVGITCTSGNYLTQFSEGKGAQCFCILTVEAKTARGGPETDQLDGCR